MDTAQWWRGPSDRRLRYWRYKLICNGLGTAQYFHITRGWWNVGDGRGKKRREEIGPVDEGWDLGDGMQFER